MSITCFWCRKAKAAAHKTLSAACSNESATTDPVNFFLSLLYLSLSGCERLLLIVLSPKAVSYANHDCRACARQQGFGRHPTECKDNARRNARDAVCKKESIDQWFGSKRDHSRCRDNAQIPYQQTPLGHDTEAHALCAYGT